MKLFNYESIKSNDDNNNHLYTAINTDQLDVEKYEGKTFYKYYEDCDEKIGRIKLYTDFDEKIAFANSDIFSYDVSSYDVLNKEETDEINRKLSDSFNEKEIVWNNRVDEFKVYNKLIQKEKKNLKIPFKYSWVAKNAMIKGAPIIMGVVGGISTANIVNDDPITNGVIGGLLFFSLAFSEINYHLSKEDPFEEFFYKEKYELDTEETYYNRGLDVSLYYSIIFELLKEKPNYNRVDDLNKDRKKLSLFKSDSFTKDVNNKLKRVRY